MNHVYIILDNAFSGEWCAEQIARFHESESEEKQIGQDRYARFDFLDKGLAKEIYGCLSENVELLDHYIGHRFYMNHYVAGSSYISPHADGHITDSKGNPSVRTVLIYLNDCSGGDTCIQMYEEKVKVSPRAGRVLLLDQEVIHSGEQPLTDKYILRTDLFWIKMKP